MPRLQGDYYAACNEVFRRATNQAERMLEAAAALLHDRARLTLLSVGSGAGLFEIPLLRHLIAQGVAVEAFLGLDVDPFACQTLAGRLQAEFGSQLRWEVSNQSFEQFPADRRFHLVLFAHTFEYLPGDPLRWIRKALTLLAERGMLLIFSPDRGGINQIYAEEAEGFLPVFSEDLRLVLDRERLAYATQRIQAECDISLLDRSDRAPESTALLSFLTQLDCRQLPEVTRERFSDFYRSLRPAGESAIAHPATLFVL